MRINFKIIIFVAMMTTLVSCDGKLEFLRAKGTDVKFAARSMNVGGTKAIYSGEGTSQIERIDWQTGDKIRVWCDEASEPGTTPAEHYADYKVMDGSITTVDSYKSQATIEVAENTPIGLRWGETSADHHFFSVYPSPSVSGGIVNSFDATTKQISATLPSSQGYSEIISDDGNYLVRPMMKYMLMTAKTTIASSYVGENVSKDGKVFLSFVPLTTAIEFTINNQTGDALNVTSVQLVSEDHEIYGQFSVDMDETWTQPTGYIHSYPPCSLVGTDSRKTVSISFPTPVKLANDNTKTLKFTFFLLPTDDFNDLTFIINGYGDIDTTEKSRLCKLGLRSQGEGIAFPRHKKTYVSGIFVPKGAEWQVKYDPTLKNWYESENGMEVMPESGLLTFVSEWEELNQGNLVLVP